MEEGESAEAAWAVTKFKLQALLIIAATGLLGGLLPLRLRVKEHLLAIGNTFSGGVFLAAGFAHMLPEAAEGFERLDMHFGHFPLPYALCVFGVLGTMFMEKVAFAHSGGGHSHALSLGDSSTGHSHAHGAAVATAGGSQVVEDLEDKRMRPAALEDDPRGIPRQTSQQTLNMYMLAAVLSVHSLVEGIALGVQDSVDDILNVLVAIVGHKAFDSFAFGVSLAKANVPNERVVKLVALFAFTTPLGILIGLTAFHAIANGVFAEVILAITSGTFIYIGLVEVLVEEFSNSSQRDRTAKFLAACAGVCLMLMLSGHAPHEGHAETHLQQLHQLTQHQEHGHKH